MRPPASAVPPPSTSPKHSDAASPPSKVPKRSPKHTDAAVALAASKAVAKAAEQAARKAAQLSREAPTKAVASGLAKTPPPKTAKPEAKAAAPKAAKAKAKAAKAKAAGSEVPAPKQAKAKVATPKAAKAKAKAKAAKSEVPASSVQPPGNDEIRDEDTGEVVEDSEEELEMLSEAAEAPPAVKMPSVSKRPAAGQGATWLGKRPPACPKKLAIFNAKKAAWFKLKQEAKAKAMQGGRSP